MVTPHSSGQVPQDVLAAMLGERRDDLEARRSLLDRIWLQGDPYTDVLFDVPGATALHATLSRFVVDLNRARDDHSPNGVVKKADFDEAPLYPPGAEPDDAEVAERLRRYWDPFDATAKRLVVQYGIELILVGHSMSGTGPSLGPDSGDRRPAITLMTGGAASGAKGRGPSLAPHLASEFKRLAEEALGGVLDAARDTVEPVVALNRPWGADEMSNRHGPPNGVPAFGIEVNRDLYLDESTGRPLPGRLQATRAGLTAFAEAALAAARRHAGTGEAT